MADRKPVPPATASDWQRFMDKVQVMPSGCWDWTAGCFTKGYAAFSLQGEARRAHRVFYVWTHGELPVGEELDHFCNNKKCVRPHPEHVWPKDHRQNVLRSTGPTAKNAAKIVSDSGNALDYEDPRGWRGSREDRRLASALYRENNRDAINAKRREEREKVVYEERPCQHCGESFIPQRKTGVFCKRLKCLSSRSSERRLRRLGR